MSHINDSHPAYNKHEALRKSNQTHPKAKTVAPTGLSTPAHGKASAQPNARTSNVASFGHGGTGSIGQSNKTLPQGKAQGPKEAAAPATAPKIVSTSGKAGQVQFPAKRAA